MADLNLTVNKDIDNLLWKGIYYSQIEDFRKKARKVWIPVLISRTQANRISSCMFASHLRSTVSSHSGEAFADVRMLLQFFGRHYHVLRVFVSTNPGDICPPTS